MPGTCWPTKAMTRLMLTGPSDISRLSGSFIVMVHSGWAKAAIAMAEELQSVDLATRPDLEKLVDEVAATRKACRLQRDGQDIAVLMPAGPAQRARRRGRPKGKPFTMNDSLWNIVGMASSDGPGDVSENVDKYLAEAY